MINTVSARQQQQEQNRSAFEELVRRHATRIYRFAYRLTGNHEDAEDLVQEAMLEAYAAFNSFRPGTFFDRWILRILRNTYIDGARTRPKVTIQSLDCPSPEHRPPAAARDAVDWSNAPEVRLLAATLAEPIQDALLALPVDFRTVVVLTDIEGLTYDEVSRIVGCPVGTVRSRLHRGRALLKDRLANYLGGA
jgi:RNA polymerase sigma-70 factor (ECF subfamily)